MVNKVSVIGIDSMDSLLLLKYIDKLPNFKKLRENTPDIKMSSVFPPDSDTAWASIYTGLNPARHGVVNYQHASFFPTPCASACLMPICSERHFREERMDIDGQKKFITH